MAEIPVKGLSIIGSLRPEMFSRKDNRCLQLLGQAAIMTLWFLLRLSL